MCVDIVYTWVNHSDPDWKILYRKALSEEKYIEPLHPSIQDIARFWNRNELFYSIKSVVKYAPWVRNIYIVTNCTLPNWTKEYDNISKVAHEEIFTDPRMLPIFNSRAIEANLHRIPGLSEKFIYFNDDFFLSKPVSKKDFYTEDGKVHIFPSKHFMPYDKKKNLRPIDYGALNACRLIIKDFNFRPKFKLHHSPYVLRKSILFEIEEKYKLLLANTSSHRFRDNTDIPLATTMHAYYALANNHGVLKEINSRYIDIGDPLFIFLVHKFSPLRKGHYTTFCMNEVTSMKYFSKLRDRIVSHVLKKMYDQN